MHRRNALDGATRGQRRVVAPRHESAPAAHTPDRSGVRTDGIGEHSAHDWCGVTELPGHPNVCNEDGSRTEWGSLFGAPIER